MNPRPYPMTTGFYGIDPALAEGYELIRRGDWQAARDFFEAACVSDPGNGEALEGAAIAAEQLNDEARVFSARDAAYEVYRSRDDAYGAGRVAVWLALDSVTFRWQIAVANGWFQRARSLLEGRPVRPEHAWLSLFEATAMLIGENNAEASRVAAHRAVAIARETGEPNLEAQGLCTEGLALVTAGSVHEGMSKLDEAAAACLAGEVELAWTISSVLCYMMDACDRVRDWDRASEWFPQVSAFAERFQQRAVHAQCRPHYAVLLTWRGDWDEAERELRLSIDELTAVRAPMAVEGIVRLAELRLRQGRWDDAAALFEKVKHEPLSQLGQAALALETERPAEALDMAEACLRRLPENNRIERMQALEMYVRACIAGGRIKEAEVVLPEVIEIAAAASTRPVRASSDLLHGLVAAARGRYDQARACFEDAISLFEQSEGPFEAACARLELASVLTDLRRFDDARRAAATALTQLERLGAVAACARARRLMAAEALPGPEAPAHGLSQREVQVLRLLSAGLSNQEIADRLVLSVRTVQRHVENIYAKTGARGRAAAAVFATTHGLGAG